MSEEQKHPTEHHQSHSEPQHTHTAPVPKQSSDRFWKITTVVLIVILAVFAFRGGLGGGKDSPSGGSVADVPRAGGFKQFAQQLGLDTADFNKCLDGGEMAAEVRKDFADGSQAEVSGTPAFFINGQLVSGAQPFQVFQQVIEAELAGGGAAAPSINMEVLADDDPFKGDEDAPVTIIEFSDFECPFCGRFYAQTLPSIEEQYIKTGKVRLVYRDFPLNFHPNAQKAAEAAECADEQGKFWEMHDLLFEQGVQGGVG